MLQFDHCADLHMNHNHVSVVNPASGVHTAWESTSNVFTGICESFANSDSEFLLVAGDVFNHGSPNAESYERVADPLKIATSTGKEVIMCRGNHEMIRVREGQRNPLARFDDLPGVSVHNQQVIHRTDSGAQIIVLPWPTRASVVADLDMEDHNMDDLDQAITQRLIEFVERGVSQCNDTDPLLLLGHITVSNISMSHEVRRGTEMDLASFFSEPVLPVSTLEPFDYVALGHIHVRQNPAHNIWYPGSPDRISFREATAPKTFNRVTLNGATEVEHVETAARRLAIIDLSEQIPDLNGMDGTTARLLLPEGMDDDDSLLDVFSDAGIVIHETRTVDSEAETVTTLDSSHEDIQQLSTADQLDKWFVEQPTDSVDKSAFMRRAESVLDEVGQVEAERG